ncbi:hypothetical protein AC578_8154 [Pseudocercospora eumusae]|uniref:Uncharacterized protein n=1 Tax=Pseudocercospora eumusae TaxID=321146 RepID=A0A139HAD1_9PEZI|nr:hypothetical protein AC578_8154 [Pseudocercospora eumusae]
MAPVVTATPTHTSLIRRKHQHNSALVQSKTAPKKKLYARVWNGAVAAPLGARSLSVKDITEAKSSHSHQVRLRTYVPDSSSIDKVSDALGKGPLPASWCTITGPQRAPVAPAADLLGGARREGGASATSAVGVNNSDKSNDHAAAGNANATATVLSAKAQGKQRAVNGQSESESASAPQVQPPPDTQVYPQLTSDVRHATPSSQADKQWALQEAEKILARQAQDDPAWTDDDDSGIEDDDDLVYIGQKRRSPTPDLPSAAPVKRARSNEQRESYRSRNRRYETLRSPKAIQQRDELIAAITRNWIDIRLAVPEDIGPRRKSRRYKDNVPAQAQDWATCSLEAAKVLSEKTKGDPKSAQMALRQVVAMPGREWSWVANPEDFYVAARLVAEDNAQGPKSPSAQLSEDFGSRLFVTPTPDAPTRGIDDVEVPDREADEPSQEAGAVVAIDREHKSLDDLLDAYEEAVAQEARARQRRQDLSNGAYSDERAQEYAKAWKDTEAAQAKKETLRNLIKDAKNASGG